MTTFKEPAEAFPYKSPSIQIKQKYSYIFHEQFSIKQKYFKLMVDKVVALIFLLITSPIIFLLKLASQGRLRGGQSRSS